MHLNRCGTTGARHAMQFSRIFGGAPLPIPYNDCKIAVARILSCLQPLPSKMQIVRSFQELADMVEQCGAEFLRDHRKHPVARMDDPGADPYRWLECPEDHISAGEFTCAEWIDDSDAHSLRHQNTSDRRVCRVDHLPAADG